MGKIKLSILILHINKDKIKTQFNNNSKISKKI